MGAEYIQQRLKQLYMLSPAVYLEDHPKMVFLSDLHLGNGGDLDDFKKNADLIMSVLKDYYLPQDYTLVLNGDIEELHRFPYSDIRRQWSGLYSIFDEFIRKDKFFKIAGNHDLRLFSLKHDRAREKLSEALKLIYQDDQTIFVFHGHQASHLNIKNKDLIAFVLRNFANPLHIRNRSTAHREHRKFRIEKHAYRFSSENKIISIIGHTHRPLFESLAKIDSLKFKIEQMCRTYHLASPAEKKSIEEEIQFHKQKLEFQYRKNRKHGSRGSLYNSRLLIPCLFNSGCAIGKRGITAIEIEKDLIHLIYWFDGSRNGTYFKHQEYSPEQLSPTEYYRTVLKSDSLDYIFSRIKLLA